MDSRDKEEKLKYSSIQHVKVTTYAGCSDSTSQCTSSEVSGSTYDPDDWPDYPFTGRMMSKKGSVYNICDIDYGSNGHTVYQRFA